MGDGRESGVGLAHAEEGTEGYTVVSASSTMEKWVNVYVFAPCVIER